MRCITNADRKAAAARTFQQRMAKMKQHGGMKAAASAISPAAGVAPTWVNPNVTTPDQLYFSNFANYANSPLPFVDPVTKAVTGGIRKFVDTLPGLNSPNDLGQQIPVAVPDTTTFPGSDYYEISLQQYSEQMHADLPAVTLRGYVQTNNGTDPTGHNTVAPASIHYLGPLILAQSNRPVRIKFTNNLGTGTAGNLFIPADLSYMGAGMGPDGSKYTENRATLHLHGGATPWISDGTPHQWTVPVGEVATYSRGDSVQFVPDMFFNASGQVVQVPQCSSTITTACYPNAVPSGLSNDPGQGSLTFYYTNQQSGRLMFYHDHAYGITRLNVYAGEAAGYLLTDSTEATLASGGTINGVSIAANTIPGLVDNIPLVIQDKTFVPPNPASSPVYSVSIVDPGGYYTTPVVTFTGGGCAVEPTATATMGEITIGLPPVTIENAITAIILTNAGTGCDPKSPPTVTITDAGLTGSGATAFAYMGSLAQQDPTWDTTLWGGPGQLWFPHVYLPNQWPASPDNYLPPAVDAGGANPMGRWDYGMWFWPVMNRSELKHADIACPSAIDPTQMCPGTPSALNPDVKTGSIASGVPEGFMDTMLVNGTVYPTVTLQPKAYRLRILNAANDRTLNLSLFIADPIAVSADGRRNTEVKMVPATPGTAGFPSYWPTDGRDGGVPDPATAGPPWIQIGTEGGLLPQPVVIPPAPVNYEYNRRSITVLNISTHSLLLGPAERADVIVDFSKFAGTTLILYNDSPAPVPAFDSRIDYYTGDPDQSATGGAPTTLPGYGPNTRTVMQITVAGTPVPFNPNPLNTALPAAFAATQPVPVIPEAAYSQAYKTTLRNQYLNIFTNSATFTPINSTGAVPPPAAVTVPAGLKTIQELFELNYGRMNATLGTELPFTSFNTQTTIPLGYTDPATEIIQNSGLTGSPVAVLGDGTQIWHVVHNGVDTHAVHVHLMNIQLINRNGWDGTVRPPEPNELGWKETVRMNPLETAFVALRPVAMNLPFPIPDSFRRLDVTCPIGVTNGEGCTTFSNIDPYTNNPVTTVNIVANFGWEYVWHCHLLGHEENDMMRPIIFEVAPPAPSNLAATGLATGINVTFTDNSLSEDGFTLQRADDINFTTNVTSTILPAQAGYGTTVASLDTTAVPGQTYYYRVNAFSTQNGTSPWSNTATVVYKLAQTITFGPLANVTYGVAPFAITATSSSGLPVTFTVVSGPATVLGNTVTITGVGTVTIQADQVGNTLYLPALPVQQSFTVSKAALTITASSATVTYGGTVPAITPIYAGFVYGETAANLITPPTCSTTATTGGPAGTYPSSCSGAAAANYTISYVAGTVTIAKATLTITASSGSMTYGAKAPTITPSFAGFVNGDTSAVLTTPPTCTTTATSATPAGTRPSSCSGAAAANYTIAYINGTVTINKAALVVTANNLVKSAGQANPTLTYSVTGFVNGETQAVLSGAPSLSTTATTSSVPGTYPITITAGTLAAANYSFTFVNGTLTVTAGSGPVLSLSPTSLSFSTPLGFVGAPQQATVSNTGAGTLTFTSIALVGTNANQFRLTNSCGGTLAAGGSCKLTVSFTPTSGTPNPKSASLNVNVAAPATSQSVTLTGTVVAPTYTVSPTSLAFGTVTHNTTSAPQTVTVTNTSPLASLTITSFSKTGTNASQFSVQNGNCIATIAAGATCHFTVTFSPVLPVGTKSATVNINVTAPGTSGTLAVGGTSN
jgi:FtsP/CotA-like multicopper oxidase with cupredoxin domain